MRLDVREWGRVTPPIPAEPPPEGNDLDDWQVWTAVGNPRAASHGLLGASLEVKSKRQSNFGIRGFSGMPYKYNTRFRGFSGVPYKYYRQRGRR